MIPRPDGPPLLVRLCLRAILPKREREFFLGDFEGRSRPSWLREIGGAVMLRLSPPPATRHVPGNRGDGVLRDFLHDLKHGLRVMRRGPLFTAAAVLTIAMGIGANTAMFSLVRGVLLKPLPYPEAERLVVLAASNQALGLETAPVSPLDFLDWQARIHSVDRMAAWVDGSANYTGGTQPETLAMMAVSAEYLSLLGGSPVMGRGFTGEDTNPNGPPIALVTHGFWQRVLGARPDMLGRPITLNGVAHTVVGIVPAAWRPPAGTRPDVILPLRMRPAWLASRAPHFLKAIGRVRQGVPQDQVRAEFKATAGALAAEYPDTNAGWGTVVTPLAEHVLGSTGRQLVVFMASVGFVLLMACANLANLMLARVTGRSRELATRAAMGACRWRLIRQLATESLLLATIGGAVGVGLASGAVRTLVAGWPDLLPRMHEIGIDSSVLLFSASLAIVSGLFFGMVPALGITRRASLAQLGHGGRGVAGGVGSPSLRAGLVVAQVSLAVVLLVGTGLLVQSFVALQAENPGFQTSNRLAVATPLPAKRYATGEKIRAFGEALVSAAGRLPGVESAALTTLVPMQGPDEMASVWAHGRVGARSDGDGDGSAMLVRVSPRYFETMAIALRAGRAIAETDNETAPAVVVISESLAARVFPTGNPIGQRLRFDRDPAAPLVEVVGVVADVRQYDRGRASTPQVYVPFRQDPVAALHLVVRASIPAERLVPALRRTVADLDRDQPLASIETLDSLASNAVSIPRFRTLLMTAFGAMALLLAVMGLYGVMACSVAQRTKEIGLRMALGATRGSVLGLVLRDGTVLLAGGLVVGLAGALALSRILQSMLFGVGTHDPVVFAAVPLVLGAVAVLTMLVPAHRATRVDPARTLAAE